MSIKKSWHQEAFQGTDKKKNYFEGWYFKLIDKRRETVLAIIPGIALGKNKEDAHSFIQVIDAVKGKTQYHRFPFEDFKADRDKFAVRIGPNEFSDHHIKLDLCSDTDRIFGQLDFKDIVKYPQSVLSPGIMGPFSFVPCMECYHGVVNIHQTVHGCLTVNGLEIDMSGGEGYIEKDWGKSFPDSWIWLQANHFEQEGASFMFSTARIPWMGGSFTGLVAFLRTDKDFYKFATYNGSKITKLEFDGDILHGTVKNRRYILEFSTKSSKGGILKAPKNGLMHREIQESITAEIELRLMSPNRSILFQGNSKWVGMELCGEVPIMKNIAQHKVKENKNVL